MEAKAGTERIERTTGHAVVLTMRVRNVSEDLTIYPLDPAFTRKTHSGESVATGLVVGRQTFWGGAIEWPFPARVKREYELAQADDAAPLQPGEVREYVVFTDANRQIVRAVQTAQEPIHWRVQIRRGLIPYRGDEVPVTAIIEVEIDPGEVEVVE